MKQKFLLISIFSFSLIDCFAQKTININEFESLIDFANCRYIKAFIENNDTDSSFYNEEELNKIKENLEIVKLDDFETILNYDELVILIKQYESALELAETINKRKLEYSYTQTDEKLLQKLKAMSWESVDLMPVSNEIVSSVQEFYNNRYSQVSQKSTKGVKPQSISNAIPDNDFTYKELKRSMQKTMMIFLFIGCVLFILNILIIMYLIRWRVNLREYIIEQVLHSQRINKRFSSKNKKTSNVTLSERSEPVDNVILEITRHKSFDDYNVKPKSQREPVYSSNTPVKFLKGKSGKFFTRAEDNPNNSFFKLYNEMNGIALFEFSGDEAEAIAKRIFSEDICEIVEGNYQKASSVITSTPGKVKQVDDQWEVVEPVKIILT